MMTKEIQEKPEGLKEPCLNQVQVCRLLGFSKTEFYRKVSGGELAPAYRLHRRKGIVVPKSVVETYLVDKQIHI